MYSCYYGGKNGLAYNLTLSDDLLAVRTKNKKKLLDAVASKAGKSIISQFNTIAQFSDAGVFILKGQEKSLQTLELRDRARRVLSREEDVRFAGRVLKEESSGKPVVFTENFFIKFWDEVTTSECESIIAKYQLNIKKSLSYAKNAYFVSSSEGTGLEIFQIAQQILEEKNTEFCHPELIRECRYRVIHPQQWHLQEITVNGTNIDAHPNIEKAWEMTKGSDIVIAIVDDGVDIDHEEFSGDNKVVSPRDVTEQINDPRPKDPFAFFDVFDNHGTACAGVACASGNNASGVAPDARLMPIRFASGLGSQAEADAFVWATDQGADVISCSWGPEDGEWWNPSDPQHDVVAPLPDSTRLAINYAVENGRNGKGCVITWAAGNGNENVENDGYASYDKVIAVGACNDRNKRSIYSDFGESVWCCFPSNDFGYAPLAHPEPISSGIWTTDREGAAGYNPGIISPFDSDPPGDDSGNYTENFGGTSSACPGVAGIAALILSANPDLYWYQVKDILALVAVKIDSSAGSYDSYGHSPFYGFGRPDAAKAVRIAKELKD